MGRPKQTITDREKAAIYLHLYGGVEDWKLLYLISRPGEMIQDPKDITYLSDLTSKWKNSEKIRDYIDLVKMDQARKIIAIEERAKEEGRKEKEAGGNERTETETKNRIDYYDPANQRKQINRIIAESSDDPKTQLDAIKAIQQTQRDDRQAAKDSQIQRFYTPAQCRDCIIKANFAKLRRRLQAQEGQPEE